ncbi:AIPR family protein [Micromonospora arida]|uniref:AIPR family protein n=1 Tax=Micromonospora arida TaxID=2203715 RepID=UPI003CE7AD29
MSEPGLDEFAEQLQQDLISEASLVGEERMIRDVFVARMVADLSEAGELDDGEACFHQARGVEVSGYHLSADGQTLDLFGVVLTQTAPPVTVPKASVDTCLRRLRAFLDRAKAGDHASREQGLPVFDMFMSIHQEWSSVTRIRLFVFTDGLTTVGHMAEQQIDGVPTSTHIWDVRRLHRLTTSGMRQDPVDVDFAGSYGGPVPCLSVKQDGSDYQTLLAVVPGVVLRQVYAEFGGRLLELNVRSFLQARGKINQGIRKTINDEPTRFLAYNNGISATAAEATVVVVEGGGLGIARLRNFQIVNGGQTTASLYHAAVKDNSPLEAVHVQMKVTVVPPERLDGFVPLISRYANSQNKVNEADFSANHPFHVQIEKLSRTVWAPAADGTQRQTRWFYERARGQYQDAVSRAESRKRQAQFKETHPLKQKFTKTDLAKYEMAFDQHPHLVSLGAQKCFTEFTLRLVGRSDKTVTTAYFEDLVAKAILFRDAELLVSGLRLGAYRANVVAYAIALLSERTEGRLNLASIWRLQSLSPAVTGSITDLAPRVRQVLVDAPGSGNVTEWAKRQACWEQVRRIDWQVPAALKAELRAGPAANVPVQPRDPEQIAPTIG